MNAYRITTIAWLALVLAGLAAMIGVFVWALCDKDAVGLNLNGLRTR